MTTPLIPNSELVAKHWLLAAVTGLDNNVATTLPDAPWPNNEFVQIMNVGGTPDMDVPRFDPVVSINCFAMVPGSSKPPWGRAAHLFSRIVTACYQIRYANDPSVKLALPDDYGDALVTSCWPVSDLRKIPSDPSQYAAYNFDMAMSWVPASLVIA